MPSESKLSPKEEVKYLMAMFDTPQECLRFLHDQFNVIQARAQAILSLGTLTLTITGFSGPKIAQTNAFSRYSIAIGITLVLFSLATVLLGSTKIRWVSQALTNEPLESLERVISYRNKKTQLYYLELYLLVIGLSFYVASVVSFLVFWVE